MRQPPISKRWETDARYYEAMLHQDLFGDWQLTLVWGGKRSRLGGRKSKIMASYQEGLKALAELHAARIKHGYRLL